MRPFLETNDFSVSNETFQLLHDEELDLLVTRPRPKNLDKYYHSASYISHTDSNRTLVEQMYQKIKKVNIWLKVRLIKRYAKGDKSVLDVGAGTGDFLIGAKNKGWQVAGVEPNADARLRSREKKMELLADLKSLDDQKFQIITLWHVLEHVPDLNEQIIKLRQHLDLNGTLVVAVPNYRSYDARHYKKYWAAYDVPRHLWHFSKTAIDKLFAKHEMKVVRAKPMWFDAFYVSLLSEKYKSGKQNFFKAIFVGLRSNIIGLLTGEYSSMIYILKNK